MLTSFPSTHGPPSSSCIRLQGTVVRLGSNVKTHALGQRVALEPGRSCGLCPTCKKGLYELCPDMQFAATPPYTRGTLCRCASLIPAVCTP